SPAIPPQNFSGSLSASLHRCSYSARFLMCACALNSGGGGKTRFSCSTESIFWSATAGVCAMGDLLAKPTILPNARTGFSPRRYQGREESSSPCFGEKAQATPELADFPPHFL